MEAEADIYEQLQLWVDLFVAFAKTASPAEVLESVHSNATFWQSFLGVSATIADEKYAVSRLIHFPLSLFWKKKTQLTHNA